MFLTQIYDSKDYSKEWGDFSGDGAVETFVAGKKLYLGYHKPIPSIYIEFKESASSDINLVISYATLSGMKAVTDLIDDTDGFNHSGKIVWNYERKDHVKSTIEGKNLFWYEIDFSADTTPRHIVGINTIFSYDSDLDEEHPNIKKFLPRGDDGVFAKSFVKFHMSARKEIVQILRKKFNLNSKVLDQFDLLNIEEVHQASKFLTLSKIFSWLADGGQDDKWRIKSREFYKTFADFIDATSISIDENDNGVADPAENYAIKSIRITRE